MEQQDNQSTGFMIIYNVLLNNSEYKLTVDEFYFYVFIIRRISLFDRVYETSLDSIYSLQSRYKINKSNKKDVMIKIKENINSLVDKKVISINIDILSNKVQYNTFFEISQIPLDRKRGFEKLTKSVYDLCDNRYALYIINHLNQFKDKKAEKSLENWRTTLGGVSKNTVAKYLKQLCDQGKLFRKAGKKFYDEGDITEEPMTYSLIPFAEKVIKTNVDTPNVSAVSLNHPNLQVDESSVPVNVESVKVAKVADKSNYGNWSKHGANLTDDDYDLYAAHENDEEFTKVVDKKINIISKNKTNEKVVEMYEKYLQSARDRLEDKNREARYVLVDKHREMVISNHQTGQCLTFNNINSTPEQSDMMSVDVEQFAAMNTSELKKLNTLYTSFDYNEYTYKVEEQSVPFSHGFSEDSGLIENCSESTVLKIRDEIVKQINENGKIDVSKLRSYKQELLDECNNGKPMDVEWEGDHYISGENHSLRQRQRMMGNKSKKDKDSYEKVTDITRFLDREKDKSDMVVDGLPF